jgi:hypothetical protein
MVICTKGEKMKLLSGTLTFATLFVLLVATMGCDNGTIPETARDVKIAEHQGKNIYVNCLPSQDELKDKIATQVESILSYPDSTAEKFRNYIQQKGMRIILEDVPEYDNGQDFRIVSDSAFAVRVAFVASTSVPDLYGAISLAVVYMNYAYQIVLLDKQFNNAAIDRWTNFAYITYQKGFSGIV